MLQTLDFRQSLDSRPLLDSRQTLDSKQSIDYRQSLDSGQAPALDSQLPEGSDHQGCCEALKFGFRKSTPPQNR